MEHNHTQGICCALLKSKGTRCTCRTKKGHDLCGKHFKSNNVIRYDSINNIQNITSSLLINNKVDKITNDNSILIPIHYRSRMRYNTVKVRDLVKTLNHYKRIKQGGTENVDHIISAYNRLM